MIEEAGMPALRAKSVGLTEFAIRLADDWLAPLGVTLASPADSAERGGHVTLHHDAMREVTARLWQQDVIPDYRDPGGLRIGLSPALDELRGGAPRAARHGRDAPRGARRASRSRVGEYQHDGAVASPPPGLRPRRPARVAWPNRRQASDERSAIMTDTGANTNAATGDAIDDATAAARKASEAVTDAAKGAATSAKKGARDAADSVTGAATNAAKGVSDATRDAADGGAATIDDLKDTVTGVVGDVKDAASDTYDAVSAQAKDAYAGAKDATEDGIAYVKARYRENPGLVIAVGAAAVVGVVAIARALFRR